MTMNDLITRLESADGPDRELDAMIQHRITSGVGCGAAQDAPRYTASIDAALTLVPDGWDWELYPREAALIHPDLPGADVFADAATPALALCIAALRAHQKDTNA